MFAGVRREEDAARLKQEGSERLRPIGLDVTNEAEVAAAALEVGEACGGALHGLVNNAGIFIPAVIEHTPLDVFRLHYEVNVVGAVAMIQAFLPLLRRARGRIVNVGSLNGRIGIPVAGAYDATKFALEAISDVLRAELHPWGIHVSHLDIGMFSTAVFGKAGPQTRDLAAMLPEETKAVYEPSYRMTLAALESGPTRGRDPVIVAKTIAKALEARRPRTRYRVGSDVRATHFLRWLLPDRAFDFLVVRMVPILSKSRSSG